MTPQENVVYVQCPECGAIVPVTFSFRLDPHRRPPVRDALDGDLPGAGAPLGQLEGGARAAPYGAV